MACELGSNFLMLEDAISEHEYLSRHKFLLHKVESRDSGVGSNWLRAGRPRGPSSSPGSVKNFLLHVVYTDSGARPISYTMGTWDFFLGGKAAGA
jgi:hypothetical protein